jgi:hypothetical protein
VSINQSGQLQINPNVPHLGEEIRRACPRSLTARSGGKGMEIGGEARIHAEERGSVLESFLDQRSALSAMGAEERPHRPGRSRSLDESSRCPFSRQAPKTLPGRFFTCYPAPGSSDPRSSAARLHDMLSVQSHSPGESSSSSESNSSNPPSIPAKSPEPGPATWTINSPPASWIRSTIALACSSDSWGPRI